jgi:predicted phage terminase large subunit-like protein
MPSSTQSSDLLARAAEERRLRSACRASLLEFSRHALAPAGQCPAPHHELLIRHLEDIAAGRLRRLMVHMPPGSAKSTYASVLFPAWWFNRRARSSVIAACHTASLAVHFGRRVRSTIEEHGSRLGLALRADDRAANRFSLQGGGEYFATGVRGPIVGRRADLLLVDDPVRSQAEADSSAMRDQLWEWFRSDLLSRLKPGGAVVLVMTRWHPDDLGGRLASVPGADWTVLSLPALAGADDPLGRAPGRALWPEWEDEAALAERRRAVGERAWSALYQQEPRLRRGGLLDPRRFARIAPPDAATLAEARIVRAWDLAGTDTAEARDPDHTVGLKLARLRDGRFVVLDVVRRRIDAKLVPALILETARGDGIGVHVSVPRDPGQAGKSQAGYIAGSLAGYVVAVTPESGSKEVRATPAASQVEAGNVAVVDAPWANDFVEELAAFPTGGKDDQVDAFARAFNALTEIGAPARRVRLEYMRR